MSIKTQNMIDEIVNDLAKVRRNVLGDFIAEEIQAVIDKLKELKREDLKREN